MTFFNCLAVESINKESILRRQLRNSPPVRPSGGPQHLRHPANELLSGEMQVTRDRLHHLSVNKDMWSWHISWNSCEINPSDPWAFRQNPRERERIRFLKENHIKASGLETVHAIFRLVALNFKLEKKLLHSVAFVSAGIKFSKICESPMGVKGSAPLNTSIPCRSFRGDPASPPDLRWDGRPEPWVTHLVSLANSPACGLVSRACYLDTLSIFQITATWFLSPDGSLLNLTSFF